MDPQNEQTMKQKMIALAQSEHLPTMIYMLKSVCTANKLVGDNEFSTVVNAVKFDTQQDIIIDLMKLVESIKNGSFINNQE